MKIGAHYQPTGQCEFTLWAPLATQVDLEIIYPQPKTAPMEPCGRGYWRAVDTLQPGTGYLYKINADTSRPDPASHFQSQGVHGPSQVIDHQQFSWDDRDFNGLEPADMIIYELHVGTFTPEGTFEAIIPRLEDLTKLGITTIELMPVAQFPGERNWGYDAVYPFAVQSSYGGPEGLKKLVNACHSMNMAVLLDVIYNHLGPEGNYLGEFGPYFTDKYRTPWGKAINYDGAYSNEVRNYFIENALYWLDSYHIDGLRLDAIHGIFDMSAKHFLQELGERVTSFSLKDRRKRHLIAESDLNDTRVIRPRALGGHGLDAQWCDDFHHALHTLITQEDRGYYQDFGTVDHLATALRKGYVYAGQYSPYRKRNHGNSSAERPADQFVVFAQNHDQIGNRMLGERLSTLASFEALKLAAGAVFVSPYIPLLFMGEEYGEESPFLYFVSHSDSALINAVREGRTHEFKEFNWQEVPPDPQSSETFTTSKLHWEKRSEGKHSVLLDFYRTLIQLRKTIPSLRHLNKDALDVTTSREGTIISMRRWHGDDQVLCIMSFTTQEIRYTTPELSEGTWGRVLDSSDEKWMGPGSTIPDTIISADTLILRPMALAIYQREVR